MVRLLLLLCLFFLSACHSHDEAYYLKRGAELKEELLSDLNRIATLQDLIERQDHLGDLFDEIARLAIEASHCESKKTSYATIDPLSQEVTDELRRVAVIPGAIAVLERCQSNAIETMDRYAKMRPRKEKNY